MSSKRAGGRGLAAMVATVATACAVSGIAAAEVVPLPSGAAPAASQNDRLNGVACPSAGRCVAVGAFTDGSGIQRALVESEAGGVWAASTPDLASIGAASSEQADVQSVACTSAGNCVAVGNYVDGSGNGQGLILNEANGVWTAQAVGLGALASANPNPSVDLTSVACPAAGGCVAVGSYVAASGYDQGLVVTESGGAWTTSAAPLTGLSTSANPAVALLQVSCASVGDCAAVGSYIDASGHTAGLLETEAAGVWTAAQPDLSRLSAAAGQDEKVQSVSCPAAGSCTAVGYYLDADSTYEGLLLSQSGAGWKPAGEAALPADAAASTKHQDDLYVNSVSCASAGNCTAVGTYDATASNDVEGLALTETNGTWATGIAPGLPAASTSDPEVWLSSVVCTTAQHCEVAGGFEGADGDDQALVSRQSGSTWTSGSVGQATTYNPSSSDSASVGCASGGYCSAVGYTISGITPFHDVAWLLAAPTAPSRPSATVKGTSARVAWGPPADDGGLPIKGYSVTADDRTNAGRGGQTVSAGSSGDASLARLSPDDAYTFSVSAVSLLGTGIPAATARVAVPASRRQISRSLTRLLVPGRACRRLGSLRRRHRCTFRYRAIESGRVTVRWYQVAGYGKRRESHLFAAGSARVSHTRTVNLHVKLSALGRGLVESSRRLRLAADVRFTGHGVRVARRRSFTLR